MKSTYLNIAVIIALASAMSACVVAPPQQRVVYRSTSDLLPTYVNGQYVGMRPSMSGPNADAAMPSGAQPAQAPGGVPSPPQAQTAAQAAAPVYVQQTPAPAVVYVQPAPVTYYDPYYVNPYYANPYYVNPYGVAIGVGLGFGFGRCCGYRGWHR
jgi:hypothetical protein